MRKSLSRASFLLTGSFVAAIACGDDTGTLPLPAAAGKAGSGSAGTAGTSATVGGTGGGLTGGSAGTSTTAGKGGSAGTTTGGTGGTGGGGTGGTMMGDDAECGDDPEPGDPCMGEGDCSEGFGCDCENGVVTGNFCGGGFMMQQQQQGGMGGMSQGGVDCGPNPENGDDCDTVGICMDSNGCQCAAGTMEIFGCMDGGAGEGMGEGGNGPGTGGSAGSGTSGNAGSAGTSGTVINCGSNPETGEPCTGGPGQCPNAPTCICTAPPSGMVQCP